MVTRSGCFSAQQVIYSPITQAVRKLCVGFLLLTDVFWLFAASEAYAFDPDQNRFSFASDEMQLNLDTPADIPTLYFSTEELEKESINLDLDNAYANMPVALTDLASTDQFSCLCMNGSAPNLPASFKTESLDQFNALTANDEFAASNVSSQSHLTNEEALRVLLGMDHFPKQAAPNTPSNHATKTTDTTLKPSASDLGSAIAPSASAMSSASSAPSTPAQGNFSYAVTSNAETLADITSVDSSQASQIANVTSKDNVYDSIKDNSVDYVKGSIVDSVKVDAVYSVKGNTVADNQAANIDQSKSNFLAQATPKLNKHEKCIQDLLNDESRMDFAKLSIKNKGYILFLNKLQFFIHMMPVNYEKHHHYFSPDQIWISFINSIIRQNNPYQLYTETINQALSINASGAEVSRKVIELYKDVLKEQIYLDITSYRRKPDYVDNESRFFGVDTQYQPLGFARLRPPFAIQNVDSTTAQSNADKEMLKHRKLYEHYYYTHRQLFQDQQEIPVLFNVLSIDKAYVCGFHTPIKLPNMPNLTNNTSISITNSQLAAMQSAASATLNSFSAKLSTADTASFQTQQDNSATLAKSTNLDLPSNQVDLNSQSIAAHDQASTKQAAFTNNTISTNKVTVVTSKSDIQRTQTTNEPNSREPISSAKLESDSDDQSQQSLQSQPNTEQVKNPNIEPHIAQLVTQNQHYVQETAVASTAQSMSYDPAKAVSEAKSLSHATAQLLSDERALTYNSAQDVSDPLALTQQSSLPKQNDQTLSTANSSTLSAADDMRKDIQTISSDIYKNSTPIPVAEADCILHRDLTHEQMTTELLDLQLPQFFQNHQLFDLNHYSTGNSSYAKAYLLNKSNLLLNQNEANIASADNSKLINEFSASPKQDIHTGSETSHAADLNSVFIPEEKQAHISNSRRQVAQSVMSVNDANTKMLGSHNAIKTNSFDVDTDEVLTTQANTNHDLQSTNVVTNSSVTSDNSSAASFNSSANTSSAASTIPSANSEQRIIANILSLIDTNEKAEENTNTDVNQPYFKDQLNQDLSWQHAFSITMQILNPDADNTNDKADKTDKADKEEARSTDKLDVNTSVNTPVSTSLNARSTLSHNGHKISINDHANPLAPVSSQATDDYKLLRSLRYAVSNLAETPAVPSYAPKIKVLLHHKKCSMANTPQLFSFDSTGAVHSHAWLLKNYGFNLQSSLALKEQNNPRSDNSVQTLYETLPEPENIAYNQRSPRENQNDQDKLAQQKKINPLQRQQDLTDSRNFLSSMYHFMWSVQDDMYKDAVFIKGTQDQVTNGRVLLTEQGKWQDLVDDRCLVDENADSFLNTQQMQILNKLHNSGIPLKTPEQAAWFGNEFTFSEPAIIYNPVPLAAQNADVQNTDVFNVATPQKVNPMLAETKVMQPLQKTMVSVNGAVTVFPAVSNVISRSVINNEKEAYYKTQTDNQNNNSDDKAILNTKCNLSHPKNNHIINLIQMVKPQ